jgi:hypothetical protein
MRGNVGPHRCRLFARLLTFGKLVSTWHKLADVMQN